MTFDEKIDEVERLFSLRKKFGFLKPEYGLIAIVIGVTLSVLGLTYAALVILYSSIVISIIGMLISHFTQRATMKGFKLLESCHADFREAEDGEELRRRMARHLTALNNAL